MYCGLVQLEDSFTGVLLVKSSGGTPVDADALPTFRVYGETGALLNGTCALLDSGTVVSATNASPIVITTASPHGLNTGARVKVSGVTGNSGANGTSTITRINATSFSLDGTTGTGSGTGGVYHCAGLYAFTIPALGASGFEAGMNYNVLLDYLLSTVAQAQLQSFTVT